MRQEIILSTKQFVLQQFLPGEDERNLTPATPLISSGILDSISTLKLVTFLEDTYKVEFEAHEMSADYLETLEDIAEIVLQKAGAA